MRYRYCPYCKSDLIYKNFVYHCSNNHEVYINPAPCVSVVPFKENKILLSIRGVEPKKGTYDFVGGFVTIGETIEEAGVREVIEETGLKVKLTKYLFEYYEEYSKDVTYSLCFTYLAEVVGGELKAKDDVADLVWVDIEKLDSLDLSKSFKSIKITLDKIVKIISRGSEN